MILKWIDLTIFFKNVKNRNLKENYISKLIIKNKINIFQN